MDGKKELIEAKTGTRSDGLPRKRSEHAGAGFAHLGTNRDCGADSLSIQKCSGLLGEMFGFDWDEDFPDFYSAEEDRTM